MKFINFGTRNKGTFWEYNSAYSFLTTKHPETKFELTSFLAVGEGIANKHCNGEGVVDAYVNKLFWEEFNSGMYTEKFFEKMAAVYLVPMQELESAVANIDLPSLSNDQLASLCSQAAVAGSSTMKAMLQGMYLMQLADEFASRIKKELPPGEASNEVLVQEVTTLLLTMPKESFLDREETALRTLEEGYWDQHSEYKEEDIAAYLATSQAQELLAILVRDFGWFRMEYIHDAFTTEDYKREVAGRIARGKNTSPFPLASKAEILGRQNDFFSNNSISKELQELVRVLHGFSHIYDESKVILVRDNFLMRPLLAEAGHRTGLTWSEILYLAAPEIVQLLLTESKADKALVNKRYQHRAILLQDGLITLYEGEQAVFLANKLLEPEVAPTKATEIKGRGVFPGIIRGKVVVVHSIADQPKFKPGDILVTHDGTAELTYFLKAASAIVTDEGEMICHAAIVTREMKTPCIVGTKYATSIFKDGDMVDVDASKGIVTRI